MQQSQWAKGKRAGLTVEIVPLPPVETAKIKGLAQNPAGKARKAGLETVGLIAEAKGLEWQDPPLETAHGALLSHITGGAMADSFQPMNVNFGLFPELPLNEKGRRLRGRDRKAAHAQRALRYMAGWA